MAEQLSYPMQNYYLDTNVPLNTVINSNGLIMTTQQSQQPQQQQLQATTTFPNLPAPVSSASSLSGASSVASSSHNMGVSPQPNASSPVPAPNAGVVGAGIATMQPVAVGGVAATYPVIPASGGIGALQQPQQVVSNTTATTTTNNGSLLSYGTGLAVASGSATLPTAAAISTNPLLANLYAANATAAATGGGPTVLTLPPMSIAAATTAITGGSVPEFLYQLTKMLTDPNRDIIEWSTYSGNGRIEVHHPARLEREVLGRYFRHSKYSSFQRQLNYFGFRKIAGKGKMSPCSYVNDAATTDIRSLLLMKRKNSKEKQAELDAAKQQAQQEAQQAQSTQQQVQAQSQLAESVVSNNGGGGVATRSKKRRANPGNDIQPATVQPMFNTAPAAATVNTSILSGASVCTTTSANTLQSNASSEAFNAMAASIARNIATVNSNVSSSHAASSSSTGANASSEVANKAITQNGAAATNNKRSKTNNNGQASTTSASDGRGYTVAIGKGVRHQLNGYLRANNSSTTNINGSSNTKSSASSAYSSYLTHPSAKAASSAPAPLQFLDPSELGMSIENSLSQLKDNFAAATSSATPSSSGSTNATSSVANNHVSSSSNDTAAQASNLTANVSQSSSSTSSSSSTTAQNHSSSTNNSSSSYYNNGPSALTRRVSSTTFLGGMLSRDDSLINLAMLPTLDGSYNTVNNTTLSGGAGVASAPNDSVPGVNGGAASTSTNDYMTSIFSRDDSLINLAAAVDAVEGGGSSSSNNNKNSPEKDEGSASDTFGFIDFQS